MNLPLQIYSLVWKVQPLLNFSVARIALFKNAPFKIFITPVFIIF